MICEYQMEICENTSDSKLNSPSFESWISVGFRFTDAKGFEQFSASLRAQKILCKKIKDNKVPICCPHFRKILGVMLI